MDRRVSDAARSDHTFLPMLTYKARRWLVWAAVGIAGLTIAGTAGAWIATAPRPAYPDRQAPGLETGGNVEKGRRIFAAGDCSSCHASPGQSDRLRLGGGLALSSPYGTFRAPNISSDRDDGIGAWSAGDIANAVLTGVSPAGQHYYPVFPYSSYTRMKVDDLRDLIAYLRTVPAVSGKAPPHELSLPFSIRRFVGFWKLLYFDRSPIIDDPARDALWNRGRYLVEGVSHCAECHSTRDMFGGIKQETRFAGGQDPEGVGFYPNITPTRIGDWSEDDIARMLKTGETPNHGRIGSSMLDVVSNTATLPEQDRRAIARYIKSLPPRETPKP
jgi:mono/diheme cytochrome c family protein